MSDHSKQASSSREVVDALSAQLSVQRLRLHSVQARARCRASVAASFGKCLVSHVCLDVRHRAFSDSKDVAREWRRRDVVLSCLPLHVGEGVGVLFVSNIQLRRFIARRRGGKFTCILNGLKREDVGLDQVGNIAAKITELGVYVVVRPSSDSALLRDARVKVLFACTACKRLCTRADAVLCGCCGGTVSCSSCQPRRCEFKAEVDEAALAVLNLPPYPFCSMLYDGITRAGAAVPITVWDALRSPPPIFPTTLLDCLAERPRATVLTHPDLVRRELFNALHKTA